jgi:uncharacterized protein YozE (UPF0346 family)
MMAHSPWRTLAALAIAFSPALAASTLTACSSSKSKETAEQKAEGELAAYQKEIRRIVRVPARADQLVALTSEFQALVDEGSRKAAAYHAEIARLNADYTARLAEFDSVFEKYDAARATLLSEAIALRARMADLTTEAEWEALKKYRVAEWQDELAELQP